MSKGISKFQLALTEKKARRIELVLMKDMIENTYMILTNDLPSLLEQDRVAAIRRQHKDEIHKLIDTRVKELDLEIADIEGRIPREADNRRV